MNNGFRNFYNPPMPSDHVLFRNTILHKNDIINLIRLLIDLELNLLSENELKKIVFDLSATLQHMFKNISAVTV